MGKIRICKKTLLFVAFLLMVSFMPSKQSEAAVRLNKTTANVIKGETVQLKVKGTKKKVKWSSSNKSVATVDKNGLVTAKNMVGKTSIKAVVNGRAYICAVTVFEVDCNVSLSTEDGGDLITSVDSSKAVLNIALSHTVKKLSVDVCDQLGKVVKSQIYLGSAKNKKYVWDLTDKNGDKVVEGAYYYVIHASGCTFKTESIEVKQGSEFASGNGSKAYPYEVTNLDQLKRVLFHDEKVFVQTADIDVNFEQYNPLFTRDAPFMGVYDGAGHMIQNVVVNVDADNIGLFSAIGKKGTVQNLVINSCSFLGRDTVGGVAGVNEGIISNCTVRSTEVLAKQDNAGGICGGNYGEIVQCTTEHNAVTAKEGDAGGVSAYNDKEGNISACKLSYDVIMSMNGGDGAGGVTGGNSGKIGDCEVFQAEITMEDECYWNKGRGGGVAGYNTGAIIGCTVSVSKVFVSEVCNTLWADDIKLYSGGIAGYNTGTISAGTVTGCRIDVTHYYGARDGIYSGGVAGGNEGTVAKNQVTSCEITGMNKKYYKDNVYLGGIIGENTGSNSHNIYDGTLSQIGK